MSLVPSIGMVELLLLAILALVVVGPKDLPMLMRKVGNALGAVRRMAEDFKQSFDDMAREAEIAELQREIETLKANNPTTMVQQALDGTGVSNNPAPPPPPSDGPATDSSPAKPNPDTKD